MELSSALKREYYEKAWRDAGDKIRETLSVIQPDSHRARGLLTKIGPFLKAMSEAPGLNELMDVILDQLPKLVQASACSTFLVQWDNGIQDYRLVLRGTTYCIGSA